jgi:HD-like signal output (HDOD) protein
MIPPENHQEEDSKLEETKKVLAKVSVQAQPKILIELNRLARSEDVSFDVISDLVEQDVGLSAKLLKLASSPIYSKGQTFNSVNEALMAIGFKEFRSCFTLVSLEDLMGKVGYPYTGFWDHSRRIAFFCKELAGRFAERFVNNAYTLGLFHDVGAVLIPLHNRQYIDHIHRTLPLFFGITELEFRIVKTNHCAVGEMYTQSWGLSQDILTALRHHHRPDMDPSWNDDTKILKAILQFAELLNDKIVNKDDRIAPYSGSKDVLANICMLFDLKADEIHMIESDLIAASRGKLKGM